MKSVRDTIESAIRYYIRAIHTSRIIISAVSVLVAATTLEEIPGYTTFAVAVPVLGFLWMVLVAAAWPKLRVILDHHPALVWCDPAVLVGLMLINKPWDSLVVLPYCSFVFLVPWVRPSLLAVAVLATTVLGYLPKLLVTAADWRFADLVPPVSNVEWFTLYVGPLFCGTVAWALCLLYHGVATEVSAWDGANAALVQTRAAAVRIRTRQDLANRLHETLSQVVRAIPLRLDCDPPAGIDAEASAVRGRIVDLSLEVRPAVQAVARDLQGVERERQQA